MDNKCCRMIQNPNIKDDLFCLFSLTILLQWKSQSPTAQPLLNLRALLLKTEPIHSLRDDSDLNPEAEEEEEGTRPKQATKFRRRPPIPPLSLDRLPREVHETLLGAPLLLNPPSISVYTTGSSLPAALRSPENLPTANPPPGSLQMVSPTVSSSFRSSPPSESAAPPLRPTSEGISWRHTGHEFRSASQGKMQPWW